MLCIYINYLLTRRVGTKCKDNNTYTNGKIFCEKIKKSCISKKVCIFALRKQRSGCIEKCCKPLKNKERCRSGRSGRSRKPLTSLPGPRVRIPVFPLDEREKSDKTGFSFSFYTFWKNDFRSQANLRANCFTFIVGTALSVCSSIGFVCLRCN